MTCWAIIEQMILAGHNVKLVFLQESENAELSNADQLKRLNTVFPALQYSRLNVPERNAINNGWRQFFSALFMTKKYLLPAFCLIDQLAKECDEFSADVIFNYHYTAAASTSKLGKIPQITITGDLLCQPILSRWGLEPKKLSVQYLIRTIRTAQSVYMYRRLMPRLLASSAVAGSFGYHDALWLRRNGVPQSEHFYSPINDDWAGRRCKKNGGKVKIIAGVSNMASTSTHAALILIAEDVLPTLERELGDGFEMHIIGQGKPPKQILEKIPSGVLRIRGFVDSIEEEFDTADILLQPTPVFVGFRIRIVKGFCHSVCVITHSNDTVNMPEIKAGENALVGDTGGEIAELTLRAIRDSDLRRRIAENGRKTYEEFYIPSKAVKKILERITEITRKRFE